MTEERYRLRTTFDEAASLYDEVRPGYPEDLFDDIVSLSPILSTINSTAASSRAT